MANITEELNNPQWAEGIYQLETTDPVLGGPNGIANRQAKELAARTQYLKKKQEEYKPGAASTTKAGIVQLSSATDSNSEELAATPKAVKAAYDKAVESAGKGLPVGAVIGFPRAVISQEGYLKADGSTFAQATYPDLYRVLGGNTLPNLTRSDVGLTAYFPVADIPDGWIKYDDIATKVTQAAYPELYRKLVAQYGSIDAVPKAEDRFIRNAAGGLTVGTQQGDAIRNITGEAKFGHDGDTTYDPNSAASTSAIYYPDRKSPDTVSNMSVISNAANNWRPLVFDASRAVPTADENRPKAIAMVLCIKAKDSLDDVVMWVKAYGKVTNAGMLDASTLAADLQRKANRDEVAPKSHTHRSSEITDFTQAVTNLFTADKSANGWVRLPNGLLLQWLCIEHTITSIGNNPGAVYSFPVAFTQGCLSMSINTCLSNPALGYGALTRVMPISVSQFRLVEDFWSAFGTRQPAKSYVLAIGF